MHLMNEVDKIKNEGYSEANAEAKLCQNIIISAMVIIYVIILFTFGLHTLVIRFKTIAIGIENNIISPKLAGNVLNIIQENTNSS